MTEEERRKAGARIRIETAVGGPLTQAGRDHLLPDGRRVIIGYSKPHHNGTGFYVGLPNRLQANDALILLLGDKDLVFPYAETLLRHKAGYRRSNDKRLVPDFQNRGGRFLLRSARLKLTISLDDRIDAYEELKGASKHPLVVPAGFGRPYRIASEARTSVAREPFTVDPDLVDRGTQGHARTLNALAAYLQNLGIQPLEADVDDPPFDLGWSHEGITFVAEIKSLTRGNEERQLRLGLGQVLRYRHLLFRRTDVVVAALVVEFEPSDPEWKNLCNSLDVRLSFPPDFGGLMT